MKNTAKLLQLQPLGDLLGPNTFGLYIFFIFTFLFIWGKVPSHSHCLPLTTPCRSHVAAAAFKGLVAANVHVVNGDLLPVKGGSSAAQSGCCNCGVTPLSAFSLEEIGWTFQELHHFQALQLKPPAKLLSGDDYQLLLVPGTVAAAPLQSHTVAAE